MSALPAPLVPFTEMKCTVISMVPIEIREYKPGCYPGHFNIPAAKKGEMKLLPVGIVRHNLYIDETRGSIPQRNSPDIVAASICEDWINGQLGLETGIGPALTWVPGELTETQIRTQFKDRLDEALESQRKWLVNLCRIADDDWNRYGRHNVISDFQRTAADYIGLDPEKHLWMNVNAQEKEETKCPACRSVIDPHAVICAACRTDLRTFGKEKVK